MRNSIATYKETLSRIANDVLDDEVDLEISGSLTSAAADDTPAAGRRYSRRSSTLTPPIGSPVATGDESGSANEIAKYKADIQKLQASEAEIKALSFNYASILKEREDQLSKLHKENGSLKKSLEAKSVVEHESGADGQRFLSNEANFLKVNTDRSPVRTLKHTSQSNSRANGNHASKGNVTRQDGFRNSGVQAIQLSATPQKMNLKSTNSQEYGEEEKNALEDHQASIVALQATHEFEINELKARLKNEHENVTLIKLKLQEEQRSNESSQRGLHDLKMDKERISTEMKVLQDKLNEKISELRQLEVESNRRDIDENQSLDSMKNTIRALQTENANLKIEKDELEANLKLHMKCRPENLDAENLDYPNKEVTEEMALSLRKLEDTSKETCKERDKALQELARLKQHLLDKELEDTEKMDEDNKTIEELTATSEYQRAKILQLEKALRQERANMDGITKNTNYEFQRLNEIIDGLKQNLADCMRKVDSKNVELLNLQTALGQYYAEIEAKERLERDLGMAREEYTRLSESLKVANQGMENLRREKEDAVVKLSEAERVLSEGKVAIQKLGEENSKLRRALEQSMMRLNRMSLDSDNYVDRRIVIKLLVTYFQRNHSKEVLDLMVRMLGFSEEDKQRIGFAHHSAGKGVVRGVLGLPGRLVGGILGGSSPEASSHSTSESFADLWVDFLLKETEERERRESSEAATVSSSSAPKSTNTRIPPPPPISHSTDFPRAAASFAALRSSADQIPGSQGKQYHFSGNPDSEFATVPLTSPASHSDSSSRLPPRFR